METRKPARLENYDYSANGYYFITICTANKEKLLCNIVGDDAHIVPTKYGEIVEKYIKSTNGIDRYVIMPNHIHIIIKNESGTMWASSPKNINMFKILCIGVRKLPYLIVAPNRIMPKSFIKLFIATIKYTMVIK